MYLARFVLPKSEDAIINKIMEYNGGGYGYIDNAYPCCIFQQKGLQELNFERTTILYGGNGSGKSTLLNIIANKLMLKRIAPFNSSETFESYVDSCKFEIGVDEDGARCQIPNDSRIITSDDVFDYMIAARTNNEQVLDSVEPIRRERAKLRFGETIRFNGLEDYEAVRLQLLARRKSVSRRKFVRLFSGDEVKLSSNGETALAYFNSTLRNDTLYCLDEPENSLSPRLQLELVEMLEQLVRYCGCQLIIATHSPFILSMNGARIYDLDSTPVDIKRWWELENTRTYFDFFNKNRSLFI